MFEDELAQETEARFQARAAERTQTEANLRVGGVALANDPDEVRRRLERVGVQEEAVPKGMILLPDEYAPPKDPTLERILGRNDLLGVAYLELARRVARAIGCVRIRQNGRNLGAGTGFLVSPRLLMTNNHVFKNADMARASFVEFDYEDDVDGVRRYSIVFDFEPDVFFLTDRGLDYSLVAVKPLDRKGETPLADFGWLPLIADDAKVLKGEPLNIIQHPNGEPKQLALRANDLIDMPDPFLHYRTDTAPGSSGSPVFNDQWEVVALHHSGVPKRDEQGRILARGGGLWSSEMGDHWIDWVANEGARVSQLVAHISAQQLSAEADVLRKELLAASNVKMPRIPAPSAEPASLKTTTSSTNKERLRDSDSLGQRTEGVPVPAGRAVTWIIPLQISISVGSPTLAGDAGAGVQAQVITTQVTGAGPASSPTTVAGGGSVISAAPSLPAQAERELQAALEELAAAPTRVYYDKEADAQDRSAYYKGIPRDCDADAMFNKLHDLLARATKKVPRYSPSKHVYPWVDLQEDLKLQSVYSSRVFDPKDLILEDFAIQQQRTVQLNELLLRESSLSSEEIAAEYDALEAALPYNCEHVVCQSWFRKSEPMRGDLHHLFACESGCNSFRGNTPYFDFPDFLEVVRGECGKLEGQRFEPEANKGKVARSTLYFLLTYPGKINSAMHVYDEERLKTLLAWHKESPVTKHEKHRNQAIFAVQGNRNPLIDFPLWADRINFVLGL